jgi:hypothetical protein
LFTQINHPDKAQDPGGDGNDVFGMILDYYESDMNNLYSVTSTGADPNRFHRLPQGLQSAYAVGQPLIRFQPDVVQEIAVPSLKMHSAENPKYKQLINDSPSLQSNR